jgi:hypothetical protein
MCAYIKEGNVEGVSGYNSYTSYANRSPAVCFAFVIAYNTAYLKEK